MGIHASKPRISGVYTILNFYSHGTAPGHKMYLRSVVDYDS